MYSPSPTPRISGEPLRAATISAAQSPHGLDEATAFGRLRLLLVVVGDEVAEHLGVGLRLEGVTLGREEFLDAGVVLDDAVVDQGDFLVAADVRVGVGVGHAAVGGPARVADPCGPGKFLGRGGLDQSFHPARFLGQLEVGAVLGGDTGGVIAAVLEALQSLENDGRGLLFADISDDAAHRWF
jgi:hypothetical protein